MELGLSEGGLFGKGKCGVCICKMGEVRFGMVVRMYVCRYGCMDVLRCAVHGMVDARFCVCRGGMRGGCLEGNVGVVRDGIWIVVG